MVLSPPSRHNIIVPDVNSFFLFDHADDNFVVIFNGKLHVLMYR